MSARHAAALVAFCFLAAPATAQTRTKAHVQTLASEPLGGRLAGSEGEKLASDYIVAELKKSGAKPLPGRSDFLVPFEFTAGTKDGGSKISFNSNGSAGVVSGAARDGSAVGVRALSFSDNGDVNAAVVFAGYGIVVPDGQGFAAFGRVVAGQDVVRALHSRGQASQYLVPPIGVNSVRRQ
jgi:hypothetical protein